jgi:hypothetical protein
MPRTRILPISITNILYNSSTANLADFPHVYMSCTVIFCLLYIVHSSCTSHQQLWMSKFVTPVTSRTSGGGVSRAPNPHDLGSSWDDFMTSNLHAYTHFLDLSRPFLLFAGSSLHSSQQVTRP